MSKHSQPDVRELTNSRTRFVSESSDGHDALRNYIDAASLFESAPNALMLVDGQGRIVVANGQVEKIFGFRREDLVGELALEAASLAAWEWRLDRNEFWASDKIYGLFDVSAGTKLTYEILETNVHPEDRQYLRDLVDQAKREPMAFRSEYRIIRSDGTVRWIDRFGRSYAKPGEKPHRLAGVSVDITDKKLVQMEFEQQFQFEKTLAEISAMFVNLEPPHVDGQIREAQKRICETLGLDRSVLFQVSRASDDVTVTHSWVAEGFKQAPSVTARDLPWCTRVVLSGQRLSFARVDDLPEEAAIDKGTFRQYGPKSNVTFPLFSTGKVIGCLAFGSMRKEREWPSTLVERLGLVAEVFANALARARADQDLHQAYREIGELKRRLEKENVYLREEVKLEHHHNEVIGNSEGIRRALKKAEQVAITDSTVLLLGETGTGKELIARTIHEHSRRKNRIMVKVNCAALPASLVESELFGREKGAFTGALTREVGRFELANGSTILLDEIGELPVELQSKLLRVLQEGEFERLGSPKTIKVDVRVIAATSKNLQQAVREGKFREDLFYRLNVFPITIPPLRERREDIPPLAWHFVNSLSQRMGRSIEAIHASTMEAFKSYYWPGNVRELRNLIERFLITNTNTVFRAEIPTAEADFTQAHTQTFEEVERRHFVHIMEQVGWRIRGEGGAAEILGLKPTTLESRMQKLGIVRPK
jgi:formate hydrogenlyase transcriptional activator